MWNKILQTFPLPLCHLVNRQSDVYAGEIFKCFKCDNSLICVKNILMAPQEMLKVDDSKDIHKHVFAIG
jgi:hypothetical protein